MYVTHGCYAYVFFRCPILEELVIVGLNGSACFVEPARLPSLVSSVLCSTNGGMRKPSHVYVELLVPAASKDNLAVAAIRPFKGERSRLPIVCHADPRSRDTRANDISGVSSQIANPQPPMKGLAVRDVQGVTRCLPSTLDNCPHLFLFKDIL